MKNTPSFDDISKANLQQKLSGFSQEFAMNHLDGIDRNSSMELALDLQKKGEMYLLNGDVSGTQFFEMVTELQPDNSELFFAQGLALFEFGVSNHSPKDLRLAIKKFQVAAKQAAPTMSLYHAWGNTLYCLAVETGNRSHYSTARNKYKKALSLTENQSNDVVSDLHWDYANSWTKIAEESGEAIDLNIALQSYDKAVTLQEDMPPEFWQNYGCCALKLGKQTNDLRLFIKAIDCYKNSISLSISSYEGWFELAKALVELYNYTQDEDHFAQANECFSTAAKFQANHAEIWTAWATLLKDSGYILRDTKKLFSAIDKCQRASLCDPTSSTVIYIWAEALCHLGVFTDSLEYINDAENKIASIKSTTITPEHHYAEGHTLLAQAEYFSDLDLYYQAIEKFQMSLSINRSQHKLWYALGYTYMQCHALEDDSKLLELSIKFFGKALNLHVSSRYHYYFALAHYKLGDLLREPQHIETSVLHFEHAFSLQNNAIYLHPEWTFNYACALDLLGDYTDIDAHYVKSLEILNHVLMVDPDFSGIHYQIALVYAHFADLISDKDLFFRALHHYRIAHNKDQENDQVILDWGLTIINLALLTAIPGEMQTLFQEAECKLIKAAKLGNEQAYYYLGCLYAILHNEEKALQFLMKSYEVSALPPLQDVLQDDWLDNLKTSEEFREFVYRIEHSTQQSNENN